MSRIGKKILEIPAGVTITVAEDNTVTVKGPKGELQGTTRALIGNMVEGVTEGFARGLELVGVGYRAQKQGDKLVLSVGYSHPVEMTPEAGLEVEVPAPTKIVIKGIDKQRVGEFAANIRAVRAPEPSNGKGIRYEGEAGCRNEGKTDK